jgi:hypothetical protein
MGTATTVRAVLLQDILLHPTGSERELYVTSKKYLSYNKHKSEDTIAELPQF